MSVLFKSFMLFLLVLVACKSPLKKTSIRKPSASEATPDFQLFKSGNLTQDLEAVLEKLDGLSPENCTAALTHGYSQTMQIEGDKYLTGNLEKDAAFKNSIEKNIDLLWAIQLKLREKYKEFFNSQNYECC